MLEKSAWNIIKDEYSLKYAGEEHFALWAANQNELYSNNENILTEEKFALITKRLTNIYSHPMLGRVSSTLRLANLVKVNKISNSNRWALIETASTRNYTKGWLETKDLLYINRSQFDRFKSDYPARLYYLSTQFNQ